MPCRDYEYDYTPTSTYGSKSNERAQELKKQNDRLARIACKAMTALEEMGKEDFLLLKDEEVRTWWAIHKEADRKAREKAAEKQRLIKLKKDALAKLTDEEQRVLGIKK
jgi:hypothetical protein